MVFGHLLLEKKCVEKKNLYFFCAQRHYPSLQLCGRFADFISGTTSLQLISCVLNNRHKIQTKRTKNKPLHTFQELSVALKLDLVDSRHLRVCTYVCVVSSHAAFTTTSVSVRSARHKKIFYGISIF